MYLKIVQYHRHWCKKAVAKKIGLIPINSQGYNVSFFIHNLVCNWNRGRLKVVTYFVTALNG